MTLKLAGYPALLWLFSYTGIDAEVGLILGCLLAMDVVTALIRTAIVDPKKFSSRIGIVGILSKCLTFCIPFVISIAGKGAGYEMKVFTDYALKILVIYEAYSVIGNIGQIRSKDTTLNEYDAVSFLISRVQKAFKSLLDAIYNSGTDELRKELKMEDVPVKEEKKEDAPVQ